ncbi:hypothetical protein Q8G43_12280 [Acinetobacter schindleri]|uniref:hypothetical protein n=1 Tax=Acinetobacter schindleri TaxID=108981 RepID=UPI002731BFD4|nr:hypothetical protein [Acinetobacter schindleri]MDP1445726.1 hypothetical protein [Acinetobacter schindleri]
MHAVIASLIGLSFACTTAWAVEATLAAESTAPAQNTPATVQPAVANTPPQTLPANKPGIMPVAASNNPLVQNPAAKPLTAEDIAQTKAQQDAKVKALVKDQATRLQQLEKANLEALTQNQELQLKNDNLGVQVQVLQSERSAQMFLYGAATLAVGVLLGFLIASYVYTKRRRQW